MQFLGRIYEGTVRSDGPKVVKLRRTRHFHLVQWWVDHFFEVLERFVVSVKNEALDDKMCARNYFEETTLYGFEKVSL